MRMKHLTFTFILYSIQGEINESLSLRRLCIHMHDVWAEWC